MYVKSFFQLHFLYLMARTSVYYWNILSESDSVIGVMCTYGFVLWKTLSNGQVPSEHVLQARAHTQYEWHLKLHLWWHLILTNLWKKDIIKLWTAADVKTPGDLPREKQRENKVSRIKAFPYGLLMKGCYLYPCCNG